MRSSRILLLALGISLCAAASARRPSTSWSFHFDSPASVWEETLPLGNGRIGMMPDGGVDAEKIVLNESSVWSGCVQDADNPDAVKYLPEIRKLLFQGRNAEAQELTYRTFTCGGPGSAGPKYGKYQLLGNLLITYIYPADGPAKAYHRSLDLGKATAMEEFSKDGVRYSREFFTSYTDDVGVIRLRASKKGALGFDLSMDRKSNVAVSQAREPVVSADGDALLFECRLEAGTEPSSEDPGEGMRLASRVKVILPKGGIVSADDGKLEVRYATEAILLVAMRTDYYGTDPLEATGEDFAKVASKRYRKLKKAHSKGYGELFGRVDLDLGHYLERELLPMDERLKKFEEDKADPALAALYYQYGRYLLICSTRPGCLPPNLQGLWARTIRTPWNGDYHLNINLQMNLWPAESGNLGELNQPLFDWMEKEMESGRHTAKVFYGARGWVSHILGNVWQFTAPGESPSWGATNTCAAWLCEQIYKHYLFNPDRDYLTQAYPMMREAALFFTDMLVEDPRSGHLVTAPTTSPENSYFDSEGRKVNICAGSTMDSQIVRELFTNVISASRILGTDEAFADTLRALLPRLLPTAIGPDGRIMEWPEPYPETDLHHRHVSHLYGLHPSNEISPDLTPELADAARKTLEARGDKSTGWSMAWKMNFWARLHDGEHAWKLLCDLLHPASSGSVNYSNGGGSYPNLFCAHPPFQIDGNLGGAAGIAEMLIQSHTGRIELLPALPEAWKDGEFRGLCAEGGAVVSAKWRDGRIVSATLKSKTGGSYVVKGLCDSPVNLRPGEKWTYKARKR